MNKLAENLIDLRKKHNFTQEDIASKVFVSRQAVSKWERGETSPDVDTLIVLANLYSVSLDYLLKGEQKEDIQESVEEQSNNLKVQHKKKLIKQMIIWALIITAVYTLVIGIIHTALATFAPNVWLIWFTLPIVPPIIFLIKFRHDIPKLYMPLFIDVAFIAGIIYMVNVFYGNIAGAWISFLIIPVYYIIWLIWFFSIRKKENNND